mgnify:CR=1 FL=1|tara:strand:+ start:52 stop:261 length:210 start_codon:yes stop_codon:yes gene_type:complete
MQLTSKITEDIRGNKYVILYQKGVLDKPLCITPDCEWSRLTSEVYDNMLNFEDDKEAINSRQKEEWGDV